MGVEISNDYHQYCSMGLSCILGIRRVEVLGEVEVHMSSIIKEYEDMRKTK